MTTPTTLPESPDDLEGYDADFLSVGISNIAYNDDGSRKSCKQLYLEGHLDHLDLSGYVLPERE